MRDVEQIALLQKINIITLNPANEKLKGVYINKYGFKVKFASKPKNKDTYYKDIRNNIYTLSKPSNIKKNKSKRGTLKSTRKSNDNNNINNFISGAKSNSRKIINLSNL